MDMSNALIDETLMHRRSILRIVADPEPPHLGWVIDLSCGHQIWSAAKPVRYLYCGQCLAQLAEQVRELKAEQARPKS